MKTIQYRLFFTFVALLTTIVLVAEPPVHHSRIGDKVTSADGKITITNIGKKQNFAWSDTATRDVDVHSPKSVNFHPDGSRYYVNSLEGCATVVYDMATNKKVKVIHHTFNSGEGALWNTPSGYYKFTHYPDGASRSFSGKPVESTFSHGGRYLWVPYYRRTFDINAQDPSAIAIIDTKTDSIVRMMETGPLPKMIVASHDSKLVAVTHWGNNTVGFVDISDKDPVNWHHLPYAVVDYELKLNFSLTSAVNRDGNSGLLLRGTVFTPDDKYLLVGCMGGGGIAVIDVKSREYLGKIGGISNARHLIIKNGYLYASCNAAGLVTRIKLDSVINAIEHRSGKAITVGGWETCKVGGGARTIEASPSGNYVFAACNSASALYVVDTRTMKTVAQITVDSYPVGLHISSDGSFVVVTSQARSGLGGNAVNLYKVEYADPEVSSDPTPVVPTDEDNDSIQADSIASGGIDLPSINADWAKENMWYLVGGGLALIILLAFLASRRKR
ncbi:MAG: beta-propeller fold lactonase family protein [Bacteroidales bacterium]|nr:beta-propeller fold lactonase family protein [Candidatus Sodaliphilus fimicaballi]